MRTMTIYKIPSPSVIIIYQIITNICKFFSCRYLLPFKRNIYNANNGGGGAHSSEYPSVRLLGWFSHCKAKKTCIVQHSLNGLIS